MQNKKLVLYFFLVAFSVSGCATPHHYPPIKNISAPYKKVTNTFEGEEITSKTNVVKGGLGYLFSLSYKDLNLSEYQVPPEVKNFGKLKKVDYKDFFPIVELRFTPLTGKLLYIKGFKVYKGVKGPGLFPCYEDLAIYRNIIETKYPSLKKYTPWLSKNNKDTMGSGYAPRIETETIKYRYTGPSTYKHPRGRYIEIECIKNMPVSILNIKYENDDIRKIFSPEFDSFMKQNEKKILDQKGINLDKL